MFCENCGKSISDALAACPHCETPTGQPGMPPAYSKPAFISSASAASSRRAADGGLTKIERSIYFRIARGFSWVILAILSVGLVFNCVLLIPTVFQASRNSAAITTDDVSRAIASNNAERHAKIDQDEGLTPAELAQLDQAAYEIYNLLPSDTTNNISRDQFRTQVRNAVGNLSCKERISPLFGDFGSGQSCSSHDQLPILQELKGIVSDIPETKRQQAVQTYFGAKSEAIQEAKVKQEEAQGKLVKYAASLVSGISLITFITMILVLLSIERNTRPENT
ncbi:MAG: hypothetical protein JST77_06360 [Acidobacteria bacterium]|nr:hypothetical protein [Acidobacteriota bacterium]